MFETVSKVMYAPTIGTAIVSLCHHQIAVVPKYTPMIADTTISDAMKAHGESSPDNRHPLKKKQF
jgi:hypothetical protein